jgi:hypothetical protein
VVKSKKYRHLIVLTSVLPQIFIILLIFNVLSLFFIGSDVAPPGEDSLVPHEPIIFKLFDKFKDAPLLGLEYLVEIIHGPNVDPTYECLLCRTTLESKDVISCVVSARHRLKYLVSN